MDIKDIVERNTGLKLKKLQKGAKHEKGKFYFNGYWQDTYEVLDYTEDTGNWMRWSATCKWSDGHITTHCTDLDIRSDFEIIK